MGLIKKFIRTIISDTISKPEMSYMNRSQQRYTFEERVINSQEQSEELWHGVPLSELSKLAQETYRGRFVKVDQYGFLVFYYSSRSRKTSLSVQCCLDDNGCLKRMTHNYYPGQWTDSADEFIDKVNRYYDFR